MSNRSKEIFGLIFLLLIALLAVNHLNKYYPASGIIPFILFSVVLVEIGGVVRILIKYGGKK